jgi:dTDP-4-amino-4,6-dideoxygalactose transaminase
MPVHLYGQPADMAAFRALADRHHLVLIEDAAQAHGALIDGRKAGSAGNAGCFSFYPTKNLGALGDGGAVATNDAALADRLRRLRHLGQSARYVHDEPATHSRLDELQAAILRVKLAHLDDWTAERRALAARYGELLAGIEKLRLRVPNNEPGTMIDESSADQRIASFIVPRSSFRSSWHQYVVEVHDGERNDFRAALREAGVGTDVHYPTPVHLQPGYARCGFGPGSLPVSERLARTVVSLPMFIGLTEAEQQTVADAVRRWLDR